MYLIISFVGSSFQTYNRSATVLNDKKENLRVSSRTPG
jgi:hypothetical protein